MTSAQEGSAVKYVVLTHRRMAFHLLLLIWEVSCPDTLPQKRTWYPRLINIDVGFLVFCGCYRSWWTPGKSHTGPAWNLCGEGRLVGRGGRGKQPLTQKTTLSPAQPPFSLCLPSLSLSPLLFFLLLLLVLRVFTSSPKDVVFQLCLLPVPTLCFWDQLACLLLHIRVLR